MLTALAALSALLAAGDDGGGPHEHRPHDDNPKKELQNWSSLIGIITAIVGNVLIALALNVQRYAHLRLHRERAARRERARAARRAAAAAAAAAKKPVGPPGQNANGEYQFVESGERRDRRDAAGEEDMNGHGPNRHDRTSALGYSFDDDDDNQTTNGDEVDDPLARSYQTVDSRCTECSDFDEDNGTDDQGKGMPAYLRSPYWWLGQILITVGEMGNFLAYGFAPASIVSPLGVVALISNCVIAPILFHEPFRARDFWGVLVAIAGAVTVVLSANTKETKLGAHEIWDAITTLDFVIYMLVTWMLIFLLMWASPRYGHRTILIDLGLVGLFGTLCPVFSPGAVSDDLTLYWLD